MFLAGLIWLGILAFVPRRAASIIGNADLLIMRWEFNDLRLDPQPDTNRIFMVDVGAFVRMAVSVTDKPRTVKKFEMEVRLLKSGKVRKEATYSAESEREIGDYQYHHNRVRTDSYGYAAEEEISEPMPDLAEKLRTPLPPGTHAEGWVRFELKGVKHELKQCNIVIYAIDAMNGRNEIATSSLAVREFEDHEYVDTARRR
jgi:hypothetical protein